MITIIVILALYGCATATFVKTGTTYPPYNGDVKILDTPLDGVNYEVIGIVSVDGALDTQYDLIKLMQKVAAQNGANAIIMCSNSSLGAPAIKILPKAEKIAATPPPAPQPAPKEEVVPPTPAPTPAPTEEEKAMVEKGRITLNIEFDTNKADIKDQYNDVLFIFANIMKKHPDLKVTIDGHTDNVGNAKENQILSQKRAESVKNYLVTKFGIDASRITGKGYGQTKPIADNATKEGRQKNRRVEAATDYENTVK
jgi:outer membrane protein OmpA-like peptidoglycan-associated protein